MSLWVECEKRDDSRDPLAQLPSGHHTLWQIVGAGAENKDSPEHDFDLIEPETPMELEEESTAWVSLRNNPGKVADDQKRVPKLLLQIHRI